MTSTQLPRDTVQRVRTPVGHEAWLVTDYGQVRRLLDDDRLGRSHPEPDAAARTGESALFGGPLGNFDTEAADHARMRTLLQPHFSPKHLRALAPRVETLTTGLLNELAEQGPPADLHARLAVPLPILVICELLGVPYSDRDQFRAWAEDAGNVRDRARSEHGLAELFRYGGSLVERKRTHPGDDVISRLCATDGVSDDEAATMSMFLLFAGHETTVVQIGLGALLLLTNREQWQALLDNPALIPNAVEELLRAASPSTPETWYCWTLDRPTTTPWCSLTRSVSMSPVRRPPTSLSDTAPVIALGPLWRASS
jgi:pentalenolactone synthase